jgi:serine/threonine protein kinase/Tol biopolymer transport system component
MTLERGALLHKRYRIVEILGQGGMGSVYRAVDENLGVDVAVKENLFTTDEYARQFRLEAVILANLRHANLPRVTDHFVIGDQGQYLVMDYIEGEDLRQRMERVGNITEDEAILIGAAICDALAYLHTRKPPILHRDLKPGNVKITPDGHIFLVDFGLAKVLHGSQATTTGARAMTPGYSPPEQYGTARTDPRTDVYSLGATLYAALSGIIPEDGLARAMDNTQLTPLRKRNSKVSRRLASAIEKAMGIDPADRFQNGEEFKRALLGSKSKTQHLPGEYVIDPAPQDASEEAQPNAIAKASEPVSSQKSGNSKQAPVEEELPVFKPRRKKKKGRRVLAFFFWTLLLLSLATVVAVRLLPDYVPSPVRSVLSPINKINLPLIPWLNTPTPLPAPTQTALPDAATVTPLVEAPTATATLAPTATLEPTFTPTVSTPVPVVTAMGGSGEVAFASSRAGVPQLYLVKLIDREPIQLTNIEAGACQPSWSPDGQQLVFTSPCGNRTEFYETSYSSQSTLYVINSDGSGLKQLISEPGPDFDPAWSPDGARIAFTSMRNGFRQIYVLDVESLAVTMLTDTGESIESSQPAWSPDGTKIVYTVKRVGAYQVWSMSDTGQDAVQLARSGQNRWDFFPVWSPDGKTIFFSQRNKGPSQPWVVHVNYEDLSQVYEDPKFSAPIENISFSPDGLWLVFESMESIGNRDIYYMTADGDGRTRLTDDLKNDFDPAWRPVSP